MSTISDCVISSRNILLSGRSNENVRNCLADVLHNIDSISVESTRRIFETSVSAAIDELDRSNFASAGLILNLIHNLPLDDTRRQEWDVDYFLSIELPTFLEHFDEISTARKIVLCVCGELPALYTELSRN